jgi:6-phosphogluconate dehydrogenase (decarboxylating)
MMAIQAAAARRSPNSMQIGVIGLGRMGGNIVRRLIAHGHDAVICDRDSKAVATVSGDGAAAAGLDDLVRRREHTFAEKVLSAMRKGFGGHVEPGAARR